jgi:RNA polymerase primary sigma factor
MRSSEEETVIIKKTPMTKIKRGNYTDVDNEVLSVYLKEINEIPLLTRSEEEHYAKLAATGDIAAKEKLIKSNLRFVVNVARKYQNLGLPLADLINEGNIGLMKAVERFDVSKGFHFVSYAVWWIRQAILKAVYEKSRMIRLPLNKVYELMQIEKLRNRSSGERNDKAEIEQIAKELRLGEDHVQSLINISQNPVSLDKPVYDEGDSASVSDFVENQDYQPPEEVVITQSLKSEINTILRTLTKKEADIIQCRFGLNEKLPMSLEEIGKKYRVTKERIRQIEKRALEKLRRSFMCSNLKSYHGHP